MIAARVHFHRPYGLGNRLFPWARCRVFHHVHGVPMLAPRWFRPSVGPYLRGERDLRTYGPKIMLAGLFTPAADEVRGLRRELARLRGPTLDEPEDPRLPWPGPPSVPAHGMIRFAGYERFFSPVLGWSARLLQDLRGITRPRWLGIADAPTDVPIACHVRAAKDFPASASGARVLAFGERTPSAWFAATVTSIREAVGRPVKAYVVSDGTTDDLAPLLALDHVERVPAESAISDLLLLSRARVLLASGSSSFSAWAAYLGGMPAASHRGQPLGAYQLVATPDAPLSEFDPLEPDAAFLDACVRRLGRP